MKWRFYAEREFPRVVRELGIPCATRQHVSGMADCPRHRERLGAVSRMCVRCHHEARDEVGRRYAAQGRPVNPKHDDPKEVDMSTAEVVEGEVLPDVYDPISDALPAPITLFGTSDPKVALERMSDVAAVLVDVIKSRKLYARISGHEHITAEGWTTLGGMLGIVPVVVWTKPNETGDGYVARVEARTLDGRIVGAAESECSRVESKWKNADPYAIRSMAQTRAIGRALRAPLGQIVVLAGYEPSGAEEIPGDAVELKAAPSSSGPIPDEIRPTPEQVARIRELIAELAELEPDVDWRRRAGEIAGVPGKMLTKTIAGIVITKLEAELDGAAAP